MNSNLVLLLVIVLVLLYLVQHCYCSEHFKNAKNIDTLNLKILIFVSKNCIHCVNYNNNVHDQLVDQLKSYKNITIERIFADEDPDDMFDKFNIRGVPACFILYNDQIIKLKGAITSVNIENQIENIKI